MQQNTGKSRGQVEMQQCIQDCLNCNAVCTQTAQKCQQAGGDHARPEHIQMLHDCAEMCLTAAHFMQHNSPLVGYVCQAAAQVTNHCSNECEQMGDTDCANACRNASWSCDQMTKMLG
ncbi:MAG TPA: four-helix bundle copper-binding protein [Ktedonobacteraceae bacterium]|nr:four-helix bundle copper-binding protein [Ktedonobacteraceae bacterium]